MAERTFVDRGWLPADVVRVEARDGRGADLPAEDPDAWSYDADLLPEHDEPAWTPFSVSGSVFGGVLHVAAYESFYLGDLSRTPEIPPGPARRAPRSRCG